MGPDLTAHPAPAARLRGRRPRAFERPHRALHPAGGRGQHQDRQPFDRRAVLPPAPAPGAHPEGAADGGLHAQGPAAPPARDLHARGPDDRVLRVRPRRPPRRGAQGQGRAARALQRQDLLRHRRRAQARGDRERGGRPRRAALPVRQGAAHRADRELSQPEGDRLGPGGAAEHGRLVGDAAPDAGVAARRASSSATSAGRHARARERATPSPTPRNRSGSSSPP